jgi:hypothetical protein
VIEITNGKRRLYLVARDCRVVSWESVMKLEENYRNPSYSKDCYRFSLLPSRVLETRFESRRLRWWQRLDAFAPSRWVDLYLSYWLVNVHVQRTSLTLTNQNSCKYKRKVLEKVEI